MSCHAAVAVRRRRASALQTLSSPRLRRTQQIGNSSYFDYSRWLRGPVRGPFAKRANPRWIRPVSKYIALAPRLPGQPDAWTRWPIWVRWHGVLHASRTDRPRKGMMVRSSAAVRVSTQNVYQRQCLRGLTNAARGVLWPRGWRGRSSGRIERPESRVEGAEVACPT
jgi:hypothetical protein